MTFKKNLVQFFSGVNIWEEVIDSYTLVLSTKDKDMCY